MPDWVEPVARYVLQEGLPNTLRVAVIAVIGSTLIGIVLGTLLTIHFRPLRALIRLYVEVFRGLPILVTVFATFFLLPTISPALEFSPLNAGTIALILWGSAQVAEATRGAVQSIPREQRDAAAALGFGWVGRHALRDPAAGAAAPAPAARQPAREHHPEHDAGRRDRRARPARRRQAPERAARGVPADRHRREPRLRDLPRASRCSSS